MGAESLGAIIDGLRISSELIRAEADRAVGRDVREGVAGLGMDGGSAGAVAWQGGCSPEAGFFFVRRDELFRAGLCRGASAAGTRSTKARAGRLGKAVARLGV